MQGRTWAPLGRETLYTYRSDPSRTFGALNVIAPSLLGAQLSEPAAGLHCHGNRRTKSCASTMTRPAFSKFESYHAASASL